MLVPEIILEIFCHVHHQVFNPLAPSETTDEMQLAQKSMVALATTCRTFHEPAMDFLWTDLDGIEPLLGCVTRLHAVIYPIGTKVGSDWLFVHCFSS
jgi:hypothetical protein